MWHSKLNKCDSGVVGNARPCQGRDRGFEPRLSLLFNKKRTSGKDVFFSLKEPHPGLKVRASSFHCGRRRAGVPRTPCAVYRFCSTKRISEKDVLFSSKEPHPGLKVRASSFHYGRRRAGVHWTPCAVYRFCSTKKGHPERMSFFR